MHNEVVANGSRLMPDTEDAMTWRIGDHGFEMTLSPRVPEHIERHLRPWLAEWLERQGVSLAEVGSWAIHPGGPRIVESVRRALELPAAAVEPSLEVFARVGNMSSPTLLFIVSALRQQAARLPCVALGFGPGLAVEAALFR